MEKTLEFKDIKELIKSKIWEDRSVDTVQTHFDKTNKKYVTKVEYDDKKTG